MSSFISQLRYYSLPISSRNAFSSLITSSTFFRNSESFSSERPDRISPQPALDLLFRIKSFSYAREHLGIMRHHGVIMIFETIVKDPQITLSDETQEGKFVSMREFKKMLAGEPEKFTPDTILAARRYHRIVLTSWTVLRQESLKVQARTKARRLSF